MEKGKKVMIAEEERRSLAEEEMFLEEELRERRKAETSPCKIATASLVAKGWRDEVAQMLPSENGMRRYPRWNIVQPTTR